MRKDDILSQPEIHSFRGMLVSRLHEIVFNRIFKDPAVFNTDKEENEQNHFTVS